jgi:hypothetical protein
MYSHADGALCPTKAAPVALPNWWYGLPAINGSCFILPFCPQYDAAAFRVFAGKLTFGALLAMYSHADGALCPKKAAPVALPNLWYGLPAL